MIVLIYVCACPCGSQRLTLEETTHPDLGIMQCLCGKSIAQYPINVHALYLSIYNLC